MSLFDSAKTVVQKLVNAGFIAYFAGGWVRDFIMKHPSDDIDIATSASVEDIQALFPKTIPVGVAFGIVIVVEGEHHFEVATFRKDLDYHDGRRPIGFEKASPETDALRRDFTINGMFYDPLQQVIYDFVGGMEDIKKKVIRAIGNPYARFSEDRLRMMRAVRYATRFEFTIELETLHAIEQQASTLFPSVAIERVYQEFEKMSKFTHFAQGIYTLHQLKLLTTIFPTLQEIGTEEVKERAAIIAQLSSHIPLIGHLLELFPSFSLSEVEYLCEYLKLPRQDKQFALFLFKYKKILIATFIWPDIFELYERALFYAHPYSTWVLEVLAAHVPAKERNNFYIYHQSQIQDLHEGIMRLQTQTPVVKAEHLKQEGVLPGIKMGLLLKEAERISINQNTYNTKAIIAFLKNSLLWR